MINCSRELLAESAMENAPILGALGTYCSALHLIINEQLQHADATTWNRSMACREPGCHRVL
eukprot:483381-Amphidinium_carterae.1